MPDSSIRIRPLEARDIDDARLILAKASIEYLAIANRRAFLHPLAISSWLLLSCVAIYLGNLWPILQYGFLGLLRPAPVMAVSAVPIMFIIDWIQRPIFESYSRRVLRGHDLTNILDYYSNSPASGFWILDYDGRLIGLIAFNSSTPVDLMSPLDGNFVGRESQKVVDSVTIQHFYVNEPYRVSGIQEDLLFRAVNHAFESDKTVQRIYAHYTTLLPYIQDCLQSAKFVSDGQIRRVGVLRWEWGVKMLNRNDWLENVTENFIDI